MLLIKDLSPKQLRSFQDSNARINVWEGAVRAGKTYVSLLRFLDEVSLGPPGDYALICRTIGSFRRNILGTLCEMIGADARYLKGTQELVIWGKTIHIIGADDERSEAKIRGPTFRAAYVDEATLIPESVWMMLKSRVAMKGARIFVTTNPDSPFHWFRQDVLINNPDVKSWHFTLDDNPDLAESDREYLRRQYKGIWYQRYIEGKWVQAEGLIYDQFSMERNVIDYPGHSAYEYFVGVDYGTSNPCCFVLLGYNPHRRPQLWVEKEYYYSSKTHQRSKSDAEYAQDLKNFIKGINVQGIYIDPSALSFKVELRKIGVDNLYDAKNEVIDGVREVAKWLDVGDLKICRACTNLIREFGCYVWNPKAQKRGLDEPLKENDHSLDALRYCLYSRFFGRDSVSTSAEDLERRFRETRGQGEDLPPFFQQPTVRY